MKAAELLIMISIEPFDQELKTIQIDQRPVTTIHFLADRLVLEAKAGQPPLCLKSFLTQLMLHRGKLIMILKDGEEKPLYGLREDGTAVILSA